MESDLIHIFSGTEETSPHGGSPLVGLLLSRALSRRPVRAVERKQLGQGDPPEGYIIPTLLKLGGLIKRVCLSAVPIPVAQRDPPIATLASLQ